MLHSVNQSEELVVTSPHKIEPYPFGLFSVASVSQYTEAQDSWARYTAHEYNSKAFIGTNLSTRDATAYTLSDTIGSPRFLEYIPFGIEIEDYASTLGINAQDRFKRSLDILEGISQKSLERELWEGDCTKIGTGGIGGAYTVGAISAAYASNVVTITLATGTSLLKDGDLVNVTGLTYTGATGAVAGPFVVSGSTTVGGSTIKFAAPTGTTAIVGGSTVVVTAPNANNYLTKSGSSTNITVTAGGDNPRLALANLEDSLALCPLGQRGTIHMSHKVASILTGIGLLERIDFSARMDNDDVNANKQALVTLLGTPVIVGAGYTGNGPTNIATAPATASAEWMFATGLVDAHLGASRVINEDLARAVAPNTNDAHIRAARTAAVHFEPCCHYAVRVDLSTINNF